MIRTSECLPSFSIPELAFTLALAPLTQALTPDPALALTQALTRTLPPLPVFACPLPRPPLLLRPPLHAERAGLAPYESLAQRCISVLQMSPARILQRWLVLQRYNKEVISALPYCFTGLTKWPHTLGARVCALRALILADTKRKVSSDCVLIEL